MAWDGAEIITRVRDRAQLDANHSALTDTVLLRMVNQALQDIALEADWPWLRAEEALAVTAGGDMPSLPTGWIRTVLLTHDDNAEPLSRVHLKIIRRYPETDRGRPAVYAVDGSRLILRRVPDGDYTLIHDYVRTEPALASTAGVPLLPEAYGQMVIQKAAIMAAQKDRKLDLALECKADYLAAVKRSKDNINQGREPLTISPRPGGWF